MTAIRDPRIDSLLVCNRMFTIAVLAIVANCFVPDLCTAYPQEPHTSKVASSQAADTAGSVNAKKTSIQAHERLSLNGHTNWVSSIEFSPDGKQLVSVSWDKTVRFWDIATGGELLVLPPMKSELNSVTFSSDGRRLAVGGFDTQS